MSAPLMLTSCARLQVWAIVWFRSPTEGLVATVILLTTRRAVVMAAHRNTCADLGIHHEELPSLYQTAKSSAQQCAY